MVGQGYGGETFAGEITATTEDKVRFRNEDTGVAKWLPRSACLDGDALEVGDTDIVVDKEWATKLRRKK